MPTSAGWVDLRSLVRQKDDLVQQLRGAKYVDVAAVHGFEIRRGQARFADPQTLLVDGEPLPARAYLIATGSEPAIPDLPGLADVDFLTSTTAMELDELPESLVVIGGGYVGMEQAQLFAHLGSKVTVVGRLAPRAEPELSSRLRTVFLDDGMTVVKDRAAAVEPDEAGVVVVTESGRAPAGAAGARRHRARPANQRPRPRGGRGQDRRAGLRRRGRRAADVELARPRRRRRQRRTAVRLRHRGRWEGSGD